MHNIANNFDVSICYNIAVRHSDIQLQTKLLTSKRVASTHQCLCVASRERPNRYQDLRINRGLQCTSFLQTTSCVPQRKICGRRLCENLLHCTCFKTAELVCDLPREEEACNRTSRIQVGATTMWICFTRVAILFPVSAVQHVCLGLWSCLQIWLGDSACLWPRRGEQGIAPHHTSCWRNLLGPWTLEW